MRQHNGIFSAKLVTACFLLGFCEEKLLLFQVLDFYSLHSVNLISALIFEEQLVA